jgi:TldD protein
MKEHLSELARKADADYCEIRVEDSRQTAVAFQGKDLDNVQESHMFGGNVRACVNGCWGFVTFNDLRTLEDRVHEAVRNARAAARVSTEKSVLAPVQPVEDVVKLDVRSDPRKVSLADKIDLFGKYNERMLATEGVTSTNLRYFDTYTHLRFANSEGTWLDREALDMGMGASAVSRKNGTTARASASEGGRADFESFRKLDKRIEEARLSRAAPIR